MLKCGIEIHQRINSHKLFCGCKSETSEEKSDSQIARKLHPVRSEMGDIDETARFEFMKKKTYVYQLYTDSTCLVETDEEPPHQLNLDALEVALQISLMLNCKPVDELHMMRKAVLDGSNTSGFQRTGLLATGGFVETNQGKVGIQSICIEEESSGIVEQGPERMVYRLDRLGIPLVEIATAPDIKSAEHAKETAARLGAILRATGRVQRGIGTIRQDLNVSVPGGTRVEIKGAQELDSIPKLVENEAKRQKALLSIRETLAKKNSAPLTNAKHVEVTHVLIKTSSKLVQKTFAKGGVAIAAKLAGFAGLLGSELYEGRRLGTELSDYAKAAAGVGGLIHSDEDYKKYGFTDAEFAALKSAVGAGKEDAFIMVLDSQEKAGTAIAAACARANDCFGELQEEVRKVLPDGVSTAYMRPMPGAARMYPETDISPVRLDGALIKKIGQNLPEMPEKKLAKLKELLKSDDLAKKISVSQKLGLFEKIISQTKAEPKLVAATLEETLVSLRREGFAVDSLDDNAILGLFEEYSQGLFVRAAIPEVLKCMASQGASAPQCVKKIGLKKLSGKELEEAVGLEAEKMGGGEKAAGALMGKFRLVAEPQEIMGAIKKQKSQG